jgi:hypothetical protein
MIPTSQEYRTVGIPAAQGSTDGLVGGIAKEGVMKAVLDWGWD